MKKLFKYWMKFAHFIEVISSTIIFTILFVIVFGIYAIIQHFIYLILFLIKGRREQKTTYWIEKKYNKPSIEILKRQF
jgi:hypothetical protein|tara:strand:+ start:136 stop:369 length:234 start_codon:yes stop_codon:yes gene_type:complete